MASDNHKLIAELEISRAALAMSVDRVTKKLDVPARIVHSLHEQPRWVFWLGGAVLASVVVLACVPQRKYFMAPSAASVLPTVASTAAVTSRSLTILGAALGVAKFVLPIVRPALTAYVTKALGNIMKTSMR